MLSESMEPWFQYHKISPSGIASSWGSDIKTHHLNPILLCHFEYWLILILLFFRTIWVFGNWSLLLAFWLEQSLPKRSCMFFSFQPGYVTQSEKKIGPVSWGLGEPSWDSGCHLDINFPRLGRMLPREFLGRPLPRRYVAKRKTQGWQLGFNPQMKKGNAQRATMFSPYRLRISRMFQRLKGPWMIKRATAAYIIQLTKMDMQMQLHFNTPSWMHADLKSIHSYLRSSRWKIAGFSMPAPPWNFTRSK